MKTREQMTNKELALAVIIIAAIAAILIYLYGHK